MYTVSNKSKNVIYFIQQVVFLSVRPDCRFQRHIYPYITCLHFLYMYTFVCICINVYGIFVYIIKIFTMKEKSDYGQLKTLDPSFYR